MGPGIEASGGCAANTAAGVVSFGGTAAFLGKVRDDQFGALYRHDLSSIGVTAEVPAAPADADDPTGRCLIMVTPDGERTMNTHLGIAAKVSVDDVDPAVVASAGARLRRGLPVGHRVDQGRHPQGARLPPPSAPGSPSPCPTASASSATATSSSTSPSTASTCCSPTRPRSARSTGSIASRAPCAKLQQRRGVSFVTRSAAGSVVVSGDDVRMSSPPTPSCRVVDTTGAGDLYAAGALVRPVPRRRPRDLRPPRLARRRRDHQPPRSPPAGVVAHPRRRRRPSVARREGLLAAGGEQ